MMVVEGPRSAGSRMCGGVCAPQPISFAGEVRLGRPDVGPGREDPMRNREDDGNGRPPGSVGEWLRQGERDRGESGAIFLASLRRTGARIRPPTTDRDEVLAEIAARALAGGHTALRRPRPSTALDAWVRGSVRRVALEALRAREKEKARIEEIPDPAHSLGEVIEKRDELTYKRKQVMEAARAFPQPYGHVLVWGLIEGLGWQQIQARLNAHRPPGHRPIRDRRTTKNLEDALAMAQECIEAVDPRATHPTCTSPRKTRECVHCYPRSSHRSCRGPALYGPRVGGCRAVPVGGRVAPGTGAKPVPTGPTIGPDGGQSVCRIGHVADTPSSGYGG